MAETNGSSGQLSRDVVAEIRKQAISEVIKWVIIAFIALIGIAASGWMFYLKNVIDDYIDRRAGMPASAVIAFDLPNGCPKGWTFLDQAAGRAVIGTATSQQASANNVAVHPYRDSGGRETHKLTLAELPPIKFSFVVNEAAIGGGDRYEAGGKDYAAIVRSPRTIDVGVGNGDAFPTMSPFIALHFCKKD